MVGELNGGANRKFSEFKEVGLFEIEPVETFAEGIDVAEFGKIVGNGVDNLTQTALAPARLANRMDL